MITIRKGQQKDLAQVLDLIKELAIYEKALEEVENSVAQMEMDGFGKSAIFDFYVAVNEDLVVGTAIYYTRYSTWKGKRLYLEDLVVKESLRRQGVGKILFDEVLKTAKATQCTGMLWQVLDWNEMAINFYKKHYPTHFSHEWINCNIDF